MHFANRRNRFQSRRSHAFTLKLRAWLQLFRLPNLLTVPGDALAGAAIVSLFRSEKLPGWTLLALGMISLFLYGMGLVQNDWVDLHEDRFHRPERPLPSKRLSTSNAALAFFICLIAGLLLAYALAWRVFLHALLLSALIWLYNLYSKKRYYAGSLNMGLCRGVSLLLGASALGWHSAIVPVFIAQTAYIYFVTLFAEGENRRQIPDSKVFLPMLCFLLGWLLNLPLMVYFHSRISLTSWLLAGACMMLALMAAGAAALRVYNRSVRPDEMRGYIGALIRALLPWQAAWLVLHEGAWTVVIMLVLLQMWPLTILLNKEFSQS
ncbi:MAG: UbiA family prenyltransferase [Lentisphaeria bacterium]|nr:UbiA family prenyltransferase [Lentisphaeria bacterium]